MNTNQGVQGLAALLRGRGLQPPTGQEGGTQPLPNAQQQVPTPQPQSIPPTQSMQTEQVVPPPREFGTQPTPQGLPPQAQGVPLQGMPPPAQGVPQGVPEAMSPPPQEMGPPPNPSEIMRGQIDQAMALHGSPRNPNPRRGRGWMPTV
jgi:hypothetical protein